MQIEYTDHALERLRDRGISKKVVKGTIIHGRSELQLDDTIKKIHTSGRKKLIVVCRRTSIEKYVIITAYYGN